MAVKGRWIVTTGTSCRGTPLWVAKASQRQRFLLDDASYLWILASLRDRRPCGGSHQLQRLRLLSVPPVEQHVVNNADAVGWTAGGGVEWKFDRRWSIKAEYLYVDLGSTTDTSPNSNVGFSASIIHNHHLTENIARIGLNYSFWSSPN